MLTVEYHVPGMCLHVYTQYTLARYLLLHQLHVTDYKHRIIQATSVFLLDEMKFLASDEICQVRHITSHLHDYKFVLGRLIRVSSSSFVSFL